MADATMIRCPCLLSALGMALLSMGTALPQQTAGARPAALPDVAFVGVTVIAMTADGIPSRADQTVVVRRDRIARVGPRQDVAVPEGALRVDGAGKYLMPGLADMHVHLEHFDDPTFLRLFLANGVTTVRNTDGRPVILTWRKQVEQGELAGPRIYTAGPLLDGDPPLRPDNTIVRNGDEARAAVLAQKAAGYDFVKVYSNLSAEAYRAILTTAQQNNLPVAGHVPRGVTLDDVFSGGQTAIEHLGDYDDAVEPDDSPFRGRYQWFKRFLGMPIDMAKARQAAQAQVRHGVWTVPTLVQAERELAPADVVAKWLASPEVAYIRPDGRAFWEAQLRRTSARMDDEDWRRAALGRRNRLALVRILHESGARILAGTDTPNPFVVPGFSLHDELQLLVEAGLTPRDALAAATREAARFVGGLNESATVEAGKRADLLLLDGNPLDDVANTRKVAGVMAAGRWMPRDALARMLEEVRRAAR